MHSTEGLPPLASAEQLLGALAEHPALAELLLITRAGHLHEARRPAGGCRQRALRAAACQLLVGLGRQWLPPHPTPRPPIPTP